MPLRSRSSAFLSTSAPPASGSNLRRTAKQQKHKKGGKRPTQLRVSACGGRRRGERGARMAAAPGRESAALGAGARARAGAVRRRARAHTHERGEGARRARGVGVDPEDGDVGGDVCRSGQERSVAARADHEVDAGEGVGRGVLHADALDREPLRAQRGAERVDGAGVARVRVT